MVYIYFNLMFMILLKKIQFKHDKYVQMLKEISLVPYKKYFEEKAKRKNSGLI